jgi:hypothetical protein
MKATPMTTSRPDSSTDLSQQPEPSPGLTSSETFGKARQMCTNLVRKYPASTVLGAFVLGFVLARLFRQLAQD